MAFENFENIDLSHLDNNGPRDRSKRERGWSIGSDVTWHRLGGGEEETVEFLDDFADFLPPPASSAGGDAAPSFDDITTPIPLLAVTSSGVALPMVDSKPTKLAPPPPSSRSRFKVPPIPSRPAPRAPLYYPRASATHPGKFEVCVALPPPSLEVAVPPRRRPVSRARASRPPKEEEPCETDGKLHQALVEGMERAPAAVPSRGGPDDAERRSRWAERRRVARAKLDKKRSLWKQRAQLARKAGVVRLEGHYPERQQAAKARLRVKGRFQKENKATWQSVTEFQRKSLEQ